MILFVFIKCIYFLNMNIYILKKIYKIIFFLEFFFRVGGVGLKGVFCFFMVREWWEGGKRYMLKKFVM